MELANRDKRDPVERLRRLPRREKSIASAAGLLAHDVRNWLTVLQIYCDLLQATEAASPQYRDWIGELTAAVGRGNDLVAALLDAAQIPAGKAPKETMACAARTPGALKIGMPGQPDGLDLGPALHSRLPVLQRLAGGRVRVGLRIATERPQAAIAEADFDRILQNLTVNAIEAMPQGGEVIIAVHSLHVECSASGGPPQNMVALSVSDTGTGISPSLLPSIFQCGVSGKRRGGKLPDGRGMGLAVVRDLVTRAGGSLRVHSHGGPGACFEIELPASHPTIPGTQPSTDLAAHGRKASLDANRHSSISSSPARRPKADRTPASPKVSGKGHESHCKATRDLSVIPEANLSIRRQA